MNLTYACTIMFKNQIDNCCQKYISLDFMILSLIAIEDDVKSLLTSENSIHILEIKELELNPL